MDEEIEKQLDLVVELTERMFLRKTLPKVMARFIKRNYLAENRSNDFKRRISY